MTEIPWFQPLAALGLGYLLGSIPFGLILTRLAGAGDIRAIGSGNIGATNVLRTGNRKLAAATLLLDMAKGFAAALIGGMIAPGGLLLGAAGAFFGHLYPVWLRFRGGKGVATLFGITLAAHWPSGIVFALVWMALLAATRFSSVAGITAAVAVPVGLAAFGRFDLVALFIALALMVVWKHRANLGRLFEGTEPKVGRARDA